MAAAQRRFRNLSTLSSTMAAGPEKVQDDRGAAGVRHRRLRRCRHRLDNVIATSCGLTAPPVGQGRSNLYPTIEEVRLMMEKTAINQMNRAHAQARQNFRLKKVRSKNNRMHKERDAELMRQREALDATFIGGSCKSRKHIAKGGLIGDKDGIARPVSFIRALPARK